MSVHYARFETEMAVRPDDVDFYRHVHSTRYLDYVLAARFDQMERCYGMSMEAFAQLGLGWFMKSATIHFRRPLTMGDRMVVRTWIESFAERDVRVGFEIDRLPNKKRCSEGYCDYTLIALTTGRATALPKEFCEKYSILAAAPAEAAG